MKGTTCPIYEGKKSRIIHKRIKSDQSSFLTPIEEGLKANSTSINSKSHSSIENTIGFSTSNIANHRDLFVNCESSREVCISVLLHHGLLFNEEKENNTNVPDSKDYDKEQLFKCKSCGRMEKNKKMVICDRCEKPFHKTCSGLLEIKKFRDTWFDWCCHACSLIKPKKLVPKLNPKREKLNSRSEICRNDESRRYRSSVRIGEYHQVEVEEWTGLVHDDDDYFDNPCEIDPAEFIQVPKVQKHVNWLQCKPCRKWRRTPFNEVQSRNWDCSCAVQWDPIHADCAVPQELDTSQVLKELERIKLLRRKCADREKRLR